MTAELYPHPDLPKGGPIPQGPRPLWARLLRRPWPPIDVLVVKKRECPLCGEALEVLEKHRRHLGLKIRVTDITGDDVLLAAYGHEVPVIFISGRKRFFGRVDPVLLKRTVEGIRQGWAL